MDNNSLPAGEASWEPTAPSAGTERKPQDIQSCPRCRFTAGVERFSPGEPVEICGDDGSVLTFAEILECENCQHVHVCKEDLRVPKEVRLVKREITVYEVTLSFDPFLVLEPNVSAIEKAFDMVRRAALDAIALVIQSVPTDASDGSQTASPEAK